MSSFLASNVKVSVSDMSDNKKVDNREFQP